MQIIDDPLKFRVPVCRKKNNYAQLADPSSRYLFHTRRRIVFVYTFVNIMEKKLNYFTLDTARIDEQTMTQFNF